MFIHAYIYRYLHFQHEFIPFKLNQPPLLPVASTFFTHQTMALKHEGWPPKCISRVVAWCQQPKGGYHVSWQSQRGPRSHDQHDQSVGVVDSPRIRFDSVESLRKVLQDVCCLFLVQDINDGDCGSVRRCLWISCRHLNQSKMANQILDHCNFQLSSGWCLWFTQRTGLVFYVMFACVVTKVAFVAWSVSGNANTVSLCLAIHLDLRI